MDHEDALKVVLGHKVTDSNGAKGREQVVEGSHGPLVRFVLVQTISIIEVWQFNLLGFVSVEFNIHYDHPNRGSCISDFKKNCSNPEDFEKLNNHELHGYLIIINIVNKYISCNHSVHSLPVKVIVYHLCKVSQCK